MTRILEVMITITCFIIAHFLKNNMDVLSSNSEQEDFIELFNMFIQSESNGILNDFTYFTRNTIIFASGNRIPNKNS